MASVEGAESWWEDKDFPVGTETLAGDVTSDVKWLRPHELSDDPKLFVNGASRLDVKQGKLGNCWCIAACAAIAEQKDLVKELIPNDEDGTPQELSKSSPKYTGKIKICLWQTGARRIMEVDDRLPVTIDSDGIKNLKYGQSKAHGEFWLPLVEKALAKFHGGYKKLNGRQIGEGLIHLTGYCVHRIDLIEGPPDNLFERLKQEKDRNSLIICAGKVAKKTQLSEVKSRKRTGYHTFTVTGISEDTKLVRVHNPWGENPKSLEKWFYNDICKGLSEKMKQNLTIHPSEDGEYWVNVKIFFDQFEELCIANKHPSVICDGILSSTETRQQRGKWKKKSAGGPPGDPNYEKNPQFLLEVVVSPEAQGEFKEEEGVPVFVELIHEFNRHKNPQALSTGFYIYEMKKKTQTFKEQQRYSPKELSRKGSILLNQTVNTGKDDPKAMCVVYEHYKMIPGKHYAVVPFTGKAGQKRHFLLRVHTAGAFIRLRALPDVEEPKTT